MLSLFADECVHADLVVALRGAGFDVLTVKEVGLTGVSDEAVFEFASAKGRALLTFDRGFGDIFRFNIYDGVGVIIVRVNQMSRAEIPAIVVQFLTLSEKPDLRGKLVIIDKTRVRIIGR